MTESVCESNLCLCTAIRVEPQRSEKMVIRMNWEDIPLARELVVRWVGLGQTGQ